MEEHESLLPVGRTLRPSLLASSSASPPDCSQVRHTDYTGAGLYHGQRGSSTDGSDTSWEDYHSSCSSCSRSSQSSEEVWEEAVTDNGELLYLEPAKRAGVVTNGSEGSDGTENAEQVHAPIAKSIIDKQGKFVRWIRRRESKRLRPRLSVLAGSGVSAAAAPGEPPSAFKPERHDTVTATVHIPRLTQVEVSALGLDLMEADNKCQVTNIRSDGPLADNQNVQLGDILKTMNNDEVSFSSLEKRMKTLNTPCEVVLGFHKSRNNTTTSAQCQLVTGLLKSDSALLKKLADVPCAVMVVNLGESGDDSPDSDLVFCYPPNAKLAASRGAFVTINHLLPSIVDSTCRSCSCEVDTEKVHVVFHREDSLLLLLAVPDRITPVEQAYHITNDLVTCLSFTHQTLQCCFRKLPSYNEKFFSGWQMRLLSCTATGIPQIPISAVDRLHHHFDEFLPEVPWVTLPREAQLQLDDALNELDACDFSDESDESNRQFLVLGSCLYHQGYLLASHLPKEDMLDIHSFLRVHGILELSRSEGVSRLVLWREVFPSSVNRGLPPTGLTQLAYPPPVGRWFLLVVSTGHDILAVILENAGCCVPLASRPRPNTSIVREAEDTLAHIQSLGLTNLAALWLSRQNRPVTTATSANSRARLVPARNTLPRPPASSRNGGQEDTFSQTPSNLSNPSNTSNASESDENAPILGRRAERSASAIGPAGAGTAPTASSAVLPLTHSDDSHSDSSDSDSDWGSFKGLSINLSGSGLFDNPYLPSNVSGLDDITPAKITCGLDNQLFHLVCVDGNKGVVVTTGGSGSGSSSGSTPPPALIAKFTEAVHIIRKQLQLSVRFRSGVVDAPSPNKSLSVVKECGMLIDPQDEHKNHWVVGRLLFTPNPREVYVCYSDEAPQNMLELAFRLGLSMAG